MSNVYVNTLILLCALGSGVVAGIFFAFSTFVMKALGRLAPEQGISAMQAINVTVINPWFFGAFFGTAVGSIVLAIFAYLNWGTSGALYLVAGGVLCVRACTAGAAPSMVRASTHPTLAQRSRGGGAQDARPTIGACQIAAARAVAM